MRKMILQFTKGKLEIKYQHTLEQVMGGINESNAQICSRSKSINKTTLKTEYDSHTGEILVVLLDRCWCCKPVQNARVPTVSN